MSKKLIFLVILSLIIGGLFYFLFIWEVPKEPEQENSQGPTLFAKEDYKIDEREDGKYIVVEKVGLTCKVPENWDIKIEGDDYPESEYWVNLSSPDLATTTGDVLTKGCTLSVMVASAEETVQDIKKNIKLLQEHPEESDTLKQDYILAETFEIIKIDNYLALKTISQKRKIIGQGINLDIPIKEENWINFKIAFPLEYEEKCSPIWEEFIKNIIIE